MHLLQAESAPPRQSKSPIFWRNWGALDGGRGYLGSFSVLWGRRLNKVVNFFGEEKCTPDKIPGYAYVRSLQLRWGSGRDRIVSGTLTHVVQLHQNRTLSEPNSYCCLLAADGRALRRRLKSSAEVGFYDAAAWNRNTSWVYLYA